MNDDPTQRRRATIDEIKVFRQEETYWDAFAELLDDVLPDHVKMVWGDARYDRHLRPWQRAK